MRLGVCAKLGRDMSSCIDVTYPDWVRPYAIFRTHGSLSKIENAREMDVDLKDEAAAQRLVNGGWSWRNVASEFRNGDSLITSQIQRVLTRRIPSPASTRCGWMRIGHRLRIVRWNMPIGQPDPSRRESGDGCLSVPESIVIRREVLQHPCGFAVVDQ